MNHLEQRKQPSSELRLIRQTGANEVPLLSRPQHTFEDGPVRQLNKFGSTINSWYNGHNATESREFLGSSTFIGLRSADSLARRRPRSLIGRRWTVKLWSLRLLEEKKKRKRGVLRPVEAEVGVDWDWLLWAGLGHSSPAAGTVNFNLLAFRVSKTSIYFIERNEYGIGNPHILDWYLLLWSRLVHLSPAASTRRI